MYDELIKALRDPAHSLDCEFCDSRYCHPDRKGYGKCIIIKAADAIENMSEAYNKLSRHMDDLAALMPRWIPVTERLPDEKTYVLILTDTIAGKMAKVSFLYKDSKGRNCWSALDVYGKNLFDWQPTHWAPLPEPPKEGS